MPVAVNYLRINCSGTATPRHSTTPTTSTLDHKWSVGLGSQLAWRDYYGRAQGTLWQPGTFTRTWRLADGQVHAPRPISQPLNCTCPIKSQCEFDSDISTLGAGLGTETQSAKSSGQTCLDHSARMTRDGACIWQNGGEGAFTNVSLKGQGRWHSS
jgi:hypothetical protein